LKGVYLLLKGIIIGIYKLLRELYYAISGKEKPVKVQEMVNHVYEDLEQVKPIVSELKVINPNASYCSECGSHFSERMLRQLSENGVVFCVHCGKGYKSNLIMVEHR
jgi:DNA-directed RNA polymerase subunit RPC12/RpoP